LAGSRSEALAAWRNGMAVREQSLTRDRRSVKPSASNCGPFSAATSITRASIRSGVSPQGGVSRNTSAPGCQARRSLQHIVKRASASGVSQGRPRSERPHFLLSAFKIVGAAEGPAYPQALRCLPEHTRTTTGHWSKHPSFTACVNMPLESCRSKNAKFFPTVFVTSAPLVRSTGPERRSPKANCPLRRATPAVAHLSPYPRRLAGKPARPRPRTLASAKQIRSNHSR